MKRPQVAYEWSTYWWWNKLLPYNKNSGINKRILGQGTKAYKFQRAFVEMMQKKKKQTKNHICKSFDVVHAKMKNKFKKSK